MYLEQEKLDVTEKKRSNLFNWRGQFTPEFVEYLLKCFAKPGYHILDPFSGSGTVLQESARMELSATGFEINPSAYAMSKFFTFSNMSFAERNYFCDIFEFKLRTQLNYLNGQKIFINNPDYRIAYKNLLEFASEFNGNIQDKQERILFLNILFQSEKDKRSTLKESIVKSFNYIKNNLLSLPYTEKPIGSYLKDARNAHEELEDKIDLILTSPPYINVFNYHQNYRALIETFNFNILKVAHSELGSNRKNRGNRFKTVIQYCIDMELAIHSFWKTLKPNRKLIMILGRESNVRGIPFYNGQLIIEILNGSYGFQNIHILERKFINKFGIIIKEDIIIAEKKIDLLYELNNGKDIALNHLKKNLSLAKGEIAIDIEDAIFNIFHVQPSPLFNPNSILND
jgi:DNA modification methylase